MIRACQPADAPRICAIYNHYVVHTVVTFEEAPVDEYEMAKRITRVTGRFPWLAFERDGTVVGYAYADSWKDRSAYRHSVETTIYVAADCHRSGVGRPLYQALIDDLRSRGVHCAIGGIALPNDASVRLHEKLGFSKIGQFHEVGWKLGRWVDVGYWELRF